MSWSLDRAGTGYLTGTFSWTPSGGITTVIWHKTAVGSDYHRLLYLYGNASAFVQMYIDPAGPQPTGNLKNGSSVQSSFQNSTYSTGTWAVEILRFNDSTDVSKFFSTGGDSAGVTDTGFSFPGEALTSIYVGSDSAIDNTHDGKIGLVALYEGPLSDGDVAALKAGAHPQAIGTVAYLWDWVYGGNTLVGQVGGVTLTSSGTTAYDGADNPTIDSPTTPQLAYPDADVTDGLWLPSTGSDLYAVIDETDPDDGDYIYTITDNSECEVSLGSLDDPGVNTGHTIRIRVGIPAGKTLTTTLMCGATQIAQWMDAGPLNNVTLEHDLDGTEADAITDYTDLRVRVKVS